ncbi:uncharacterized protein LOC108026677 [Drosophila biarmipes]|uniref:uncharacterized protein LOC108026677 n=1 Tax=Drosophila biarmipes TaxID=125945 RepID=UPI0007E746D7|nr:uncharacterized protein LOC108026677 [Drosophila biarmipes]
MNTIVIFIISLFLGLRLWTGVVAAPATKDLPGELPTPNNTVQSLPEITDPILALQKIPKYLRRLKIDVESELQGRIRPKLSIWPPFLGFSVEQSKTSDIKPNPQSHVADVKPSTSVGNLKLVFILLERVWKDANALINKKMKGRDNGVQVISNERT